MTNKTAKDNPTYRITNWRDYNQALRNRGNLTIWIDPDTKWYATPNGKPGRDPKFTDTAIQTCLTIKEIFSLPLRQTQGFVQSLIALAKLDWEAPDYSTLSRRQKHIDIVIPYSKPNQGIDLLIDSTGIKNTGQGEWHSKKHGKSQRRTWRKVHIGIDANTGEVRATCVTSNNIGDSPMLGDLLEQIPETEDIDSVHADGAYDSKDCYQRIADREATAFIPPRSNAVIWQNPEHAGERRRNEIVKAYQELGGDEWKKQSGYHKRSLAETAMSRLKRLGDKLMARDFPRQVAEVHTKIAVLNQFTMLGMPVTVAV